MNLGDFDLSTVIYHKFTTYRPSTGAPFTLAGSPVLSVYKNNSTTQSTTGVTLTADFDSVTGLNHVAIDTSADATFYAAGCFFDIVITTGTVDSVSAVGTVVGRFTIQANSALKPVTAGRKLAVDANNRVDLGLWLGVAPSALQSGRVDSYIGATAASLTFNLTGNITGNLSGSVGSVTGAVGSVTGAVGSVTGNVGGNVTGSVASVVGAVGSVTGNVGGNVTGSVGSVVGAVGSVTGNVGGSVASVTGAVGSVTGNIGGNLGGTLTSTERTAIADALLNRDIAVARGLSSSSRTVVEALDALRNKWSISGSTITYCKPDDSTTSWTAALATTSGANPVTSSDPT